MIGRVTETVNQNHNEVPLTLLAKNAVVTLIVVVVA